LLTIIVRDVVTTSSLKVNNMIVDLLLPRIPQQIASASAAELLADWMD
jgi:hypothetical protein